MTYENLTYFINDRAMHFNERINYAKEKFAPGEEARSFAKRAIEQEYEEGLGALLFCRGYMNDINEDEFNELCDKLRHEWSLAIDRMIRELY